MDRLEALLKYHANLCEQTRSIDFFNINGKDRTIRKLRKVEEEIEKELGIIQTEE